MRIKVLVANALINQESGRTAGLYETVDAPKERANYLISIGAAEAVGKEDAEKAPDARIPTENGPSGGATATPGGPTKEAAPAARVPVQRRSEKK